MDPVETYKVIIRVGTTPLLIYSIINRTLGHDLCIIHEVYPEQTPIKESLMSKKQVIYSNVTMEVVSKQ